MKAKKRARLVELFVDPGLGGTGWAIWSGDALHDSGVLRPPVGERWQSQCHSLAHMFCGIMAANQAITRVTLELPALWGGDATSYASATHRSKKDEPADLFKLCYLVAVLSAMAHEFTGNLPALIEPGQWKGQLPKRVVMMRIEKRLGRKFRDHEADAVGMGLAARGRL